MTANWLKELKPRSNSVRTFKSYVDLDQDVNTNDSFVPNPDLPTNVYQKDEHYEGAPYPSPFLLPGEIVISEAENVLKFNTLSEMNRGISGTLICTNFKLSFVTTENFSSNLHQRNILLGENDICLINIDSVHQVNSGKKKKLSVSNLSGNVEIIEVHCKDFRKYTFSFKFSPLNQRSVISAILHHAFLPKINLLFAFEYKETMASIMKENGNLLLFDNPCDWEVELKRCQCPGWRVTQANEKFLLCKSLPESFVVPSILLDMNLTKTAPYFSGHRVPTWSWGKSSGASIVRMASLDPSISDNRQKEVIIDAISRASPRQLPVYIFDADIECPNYKEVQASFLKLKDLCSPSTPQEFWETDNNYLTKLESTKWLHYVSSCLYIALKASNCICQNATVIFSEHEGRDVCCVLSCLVQLILDPFYHTISGFQQLIQKEWVALGHPFTERHRLVCGYESEESPIFLLFLDCVWQLVQQCPTVFEFSETYLTTLWDSCHLSIFDTFLFSSHKIRTEVLEGKVSLRSVWNWSKQFSNNDLRLFKNPLYILKKYTTVDPSKILLTSGRPQSLNALKDAGSSQRRPLVIHKEEIQPIVWSEDEENLLKIDPYIKSLKLWHQCYLRWIPLAHILGGGPPVLFLTNVKLSEEIEVLENKIQSLLSKTNYNKPLICHRRAASDDYTISADIIDACQIQEGSSIITSVFPFAPVAPWDWNSYHFVPSTSCLQISYIESEENFDD